jgi:hypothetical protein
MMRKCGMFLMGNTRAQIALTWRQRCNKEYSSFQLIHLQIYNRNCLKNIQTAYNTIVSNYETQICNNRLNENA